jgi:hypothetical protein
LQSGQGDASDSIWILQSLGSPISNANVESRLVIGFAESQVVQLAFVHHFTARLAVLVVLLFLRAEVVESSLAIRSK